MGLFVAGSIACGFSTSAAFLISARLVQGLGGGVIFTTSLSIVNDAFPPEERARALGIWSGVGLVGSAIGPMVAGLLTQEASWRWFFFLNVPIGVGVILLSLVVVEESRDETYEGGIDWAGFVTLTLGFVPLIFGLQQGAQSGWSSPEVVVGIGVGVVLLAVFVIVELRTRRHPPLVEFSVFRDPRFTGASAVAFLGNWQFGTILFFLTLYLQEILMKSPIEAGLVFLTFSVPLVVMSPIGGRLVPRYGSQLLMAIGMALVGAGMVVFAFLDAGSGVLAVVAGLVVAGLGQGFAYNLSNTAGMEAMPDEQAGVASGVLQTARLMGIVIGLALSVALFRGLENQSVISGVDRANGPAPVTSQQRHTIRSLLSGSAGARAELGRLAEPGEHEVTSIVDDFFSKGLEGVMLLGGGLSFLAVWPAPWGRRRVRQEGRAHRRAHGFSPPTGDPPRTWCAEPSSARRGSPALAGRAGGFQHRDRVGPVDAAPHGRQRVEQGPAIPGGRQPRVEHGDDAAVRRPAQQPTGALGEDQRRGGQVDVAEGVPAGGLDRFPPGLLERVVGPGERQPVDDDQDTRRSGDVDALPEGAGGDETRRLVGREPLEQRGVHRLTLGEHRVVGAVAQRRREAFDGPPRRAEHEGSPARRGDERPQLLVGRVGPSRLAGIGQGPRHVQQRAGPARRTATRGGPRRSQAALTAPRRDRARGDEPAARSAVPDRGWRR